MTWSIRLQCTRLQSSSCHGFDHRSYCLVFTDWTLLTCGNRAEVMTYWIEFPHPDNHGEQWTSDANTILRLNVSVLLSRFWGILLTLSIEWLFVWMLKKTWLYALQIIIIMIALCAPHSFGDDIFTTWTIRLRPDSENCYPVHP